MRNSDWISDVCSSDLDAAGQRLVHRRVRFAIAGDAALVAQRLGDSLAERECRILDRVMLVDMQIALHRHRDVDQRMARQLLDHMVEETDAGGNRIGAAAVERSEEHTSELQSLMRISFAVFCSKKTQFTN